MGENEPSSVDFYKQKWRLVSTGPAIHTPTSALYPVVREGAALMLKIIRLEGDEQNSCTALQHYNGQGAVRVFERADDAFVMQFAVPGISLAAFREEHGDAEATHVAADVLKRLHGSSVPTPDGSLPPLSALRVAFDTIRAIDQQKLPLPLLAAAEALFDRLNASTRQQMVLHGDLHHENMLLDARSGWLAIDPKGFVGDAVYDCAALFKNPLFDESVAEKACILSRADILANQLAYPKDRILQWAFVHCVLSVIWSLKDNMPTGPAHAVALTLFQHLENER